jgi:hypothetical protein
MSGSSSITLHHPPASLFSCLPTYPAPHSLMCTTDRSLCNCDLRRASPRKNAPSSLLQTPANLTHRWAHRWIHVPAFCYRPPKHRICISGNRWTLTALNRPRQQHRRHSRVKNGFLVSNLKAINENVHRRSKRLPTQRLY